MEPITIAVEMFKAHNDFRLRIHEIAEKSGLAERVLLQTAVDVLTMELNDDNFIPEMSKTSDAELSDMVKTILNSAAQEE